MRPNSRAKSGAEDSPEQRRRFSERELRRLLGRHYSKKHRLKAAPKRGTGGGEQAPAWTFAEMELLGKVPDQEAARRLKRTRLAVARKRQLLGIPSVGPTYRPWKEEELALLGKWPGAEVRRRNS